MNISKKFPLQQGDLDYFCSIYAALNFLHLKGKLESIENAEKLFRKIVHAIKDDEHGDIVGYITKGIFEYDALFPLDLIKNGIGIEYSIKNEIIELFNNGEDIYKFINDNAPIFVYLIRVDGFTHYTIIDGIKRGGSISLFDSYGFSEISFKDENFMLDGVIIMKMKAWTIRPNSN